MTVVVILLALVCVGLVAVLLSARGRSVIERSAAPPDPQPGVSRAQPATHGREGDGPGAAGDDRAAESRAVQLRAEKLRAEAEAYADATRRSAAADAESARTTAARDADQMRESVQVEASNARRRAELEASTISLQARRVAEQEADRITGTARALQADTERRERRVGEKEERLDVELDKLEERERELAELDESLAIRTSELDSLADDYQRELERISGLTEDQAKAELLASVRIEVERESAMLTRDIEAEARAGAETKARKIVADVVQRVASDQTTESVVSVMHLPGDEMKGRIIGREGRNIRAFESITGVNVIIDDTPEAVLLSCFDPVRREIGRLTLQKLVEDGRIHPNRIEEVFELAKDEIERLCARAAEDAVLEVGVKRVHPELLSLLGRLRYRTSYGQNVLAHLVECAHIARMMASELRVNPVTVTRAAFLHDIGKALTHEVKGSHAIIGAELARRYGEDEDVAHAIEAHHNEVQPQTIEAVLTQAADACSGGRPGARRESLEAYVQRLHEIERIAASRKGVEKVFAMQAGREVRVMVSPETIDDLGAQMIARDVAKQIEEDLTYPGQIRVTVVRESRATEIAR